MSGHSMARRRHLGTSVSEVLFLLLCAFFLSLAFPGEFSDKGIAIFAWVSLIPVFQIIKKARTKFVFFYGLIFGEAFYAIFNYWLNSFLPGAVYFVSLIKGIETGLLFLALKICVKYVPKNFRALAQTLVFISYYYITQHYFAAYPYGNIAYAMARNPLFIQICDIGGIYMLDAVMIYTQASLASFKNFRDDHPKLVIICFLIFTTLFYGIQTTNKYRKITPSRTLNVGTVQHNANSWEGGFETYKRNFNTLTYLSNKIKDKADILCWSETAFVPSVNWYLKYPYSGETESDFGQYMKNMQNLVNRFGNFTANLNIPFICGSSYSELYDPNLPPYNNGTQNRKDFNAAFFFENKALMGTYCKQHLVPFAETFPFEKQFPSFYRFLKSKGYVKWEAGNKTTVFTTKDNIKIATPICFEDTFGELCTRFAENGTQLFINLSNDSWSKSIPCQNQHKDMSIFRAVETKTPLVRCTNSGNTCYITPWGRVAKEESQFCKSATIFPVKIYENQRTVYSIIKDTPALICTIFTNADLLCFIITGKVKNRKKK